MFNQDNQINEIMSSAIDKIKGMIDVDTVVGTPFETKEGVIIIPLTKITVGFVSGGGEYKTEPKILDKSKKYPLAGGGGAASCVYPIGLFVIKGSDCKLIRVDDKNPYEKLIDVLPKIADSISDIFKKDDK